MTHVPIETKRIIRDTNLAQTMINSNFVLTTNKCQREVLRVLIVQQKYFICFA
jgi:hypothetical protein